MTDERGQLIRTIVVDGDEKSFRTALTRSILGVTFRKNKRKGKEFYNQRIHNLAVTRQLCDWLYELLLAKTPLKNMSQFKIKAELFIRWDKSGKILGASNVGVSIYLKMGDLSVKELQIFRKNERIKIEFFFSTIDAASPVLRTELLDLMKEMGRENFDFSEYNIQDEKDRKIADLYHIKLVPSVAINDEKFENPDEKEMRSRIQLAFTPQVQEAGANFKLDSHTKLAVETVASEIRTKFAE